MKELKKFSFKELKEMYPDIEEYPAEYKGVKYYTIQEPYLDGTYDNAYYTALAVDEYGYTCQLYWELAEEITIDEDGNHILNCDADLCNWDEVDEIVYDYYYNCQLDVSNEEYDEYAEYRENQFNK